MSHSKSIAIACPACHHQQAFTAWQSINVTLDPALKERLLDRRLVTFHCVKCGHRAGVNQGLLYHDMDRHVMIMLGRRSPEKLKSPETLVQHSNDEYSLRLVSSLNGLIEKILILDADLDDRAIEIFKFVVMANIEESQRGNDPQLFFRAVRTDVESHEQIEFVLVNEAGTASVSVSLEHAYQQVVNELCKYLPTVVSECGKWLRVDREYAMNYLAAHK